MRVLIAPDSFTGTLTAAQAADAIAMGWAATSPGDDLVLRPVSDGGPGFLDALAAGMGGRRLAVAVTGPRGASLSAEILLTTDAQAVTTAWVESASAAGLHLLGPSERDPGVTTSRGVGQLIVAAVHAGATRVVVGVGGTATTDAGAGLLQALGATATAGHLDRGGLALAGVAGVDLSAPRARLRGVELLLASDVDVPLLGPRGAAHGFAPQKGAGPEQVAALEAALATFAHEVGADPAGRHPEVALGAGAGGGIGYALLALGARRVAGIDTVMAAVGLAELAQGADLVLTGEGSFDWQSATGKVVAGVAGAAAAAGVPAVVLAGRVELARSQWPHLGVSAAYGIVDPADPVPPVAQAPARLAALAQRVARTWARRPG